MMNPETYGSCIKILIILTLNQQVFDMGVVLQERSNYLKNINEFIINYL